ncbi:RNA-dependent RNA polymerase [Thalictrum thalictroides]|uniref:RNA-dependent RNA polymerase n=1 Tax=Thalictrum thalictroides TaxID=46969 RepID=A0A7J6WBJ7_THATH|nr:RNA-dependent RNA polymerase [Thalictrum thalictroides]
MGMEPASLHSVGEDRLRIPRGYFPNVGSHPPTDKLLPVPVSLTRSGYPTIIPSFPRKMIRRKDEKADQLVKIYQSYFSVCRSIRLAKRLDRSILESIVSPSQVTDQWRDRIIDIVRYSRYLLVRYCPKIESMPLCQGVTFCPTWKAIPYRSKDKKGGIFTKLRDEIQYCLMIAHSVPKTLAGITPGSVPYEELVRNIGYPLWSHLVRYPYDQTNYLLSEISNRESMEFFHSFNKFSNPRDYELSRGSLRSSKRLLEGLAERVAVADEKRDLAGDPTLVGVVAGSDSITSANL